MSVKWEGMREEASSAAAHTAIKWDCSVDICPADIDVLCCPREWTPIGWDGKWGKSVGLCPPSTAHIIQKSLRGMVGEHKLPGFSWSLPAIIHKLQVAAAAPQSVPALICNSWPPAVQRSGCVLSALCDLRRPGAWETSGTPCSGLPLQQGVKFRPSLGGIWRVQPKMTRVFRA